MLLAAEQNVAEHIAFGIIAAGMIVGAIRVVTTTNVVHAALWLVIVLGGAAALYLLLAAEFVAVTQILVYIGAIIVLFLFGTMLTRARIGREGGLDNPYRGIGRRRRAAARRRPRLRPDRRLRRRPAPGRSGHHHHPAGERLDLRPYLIPFWALSFVLLAAVVGAIVLARKD